MIATLLTPRCLTHIKGAPREEVMFYVCVIKDMFANPHCDDFRGDRKLVGYQEVEGIMAASGTGAFPVS